MNTNVYNKDINSYVDEVFYSMADDGCPNCASKDIVEYGDGRTWCDTCFESSYSPAILYDDINDKREQICITN
jgi:hypothetical protein